MCILVTSLEMIFLVVWNLWCQHLIWYSDRCHAVFISIMGQNIKLPDQRDKKWLVHCVVKPPVRQACSGRPCCSVIMLQTGCRAWCRDDWESRQETSAESESKQWMTETCGERISSWSVCKECSWISNLAPKFCCSSWQIGHKGYFVKS